VSPKPFDVIGFDADDTLWHSEDGFHAGEQRVVQMLAPYVAEGVDVKAALTAVERKNLRAFGYGVKAFGLSAVEAAVTISEGRVPASVIGEIVEMIRAQLAEPVRLLPHVPEVLADVGRHYRMVLITKGDLIHQTAKVETSGLEHHFHHVEIVLEKDRDTYRQVLDRLAVTPERFCMIGNSIRSDIQPVLDEGGHAIHVPYPYLWELEKVDVLPTGPRFTELGSLKELPAWLGITAH